MLAYLPIYLLYKFDEASYNISSFRAKIAYGDRLVFQNEAKLLDRHILIALNIPCKGILVKVSL